VLGSAHNLRRWAASHLGLGRKGAAERRPRTNLAPIATAIGWVEADGAFRQRLLLERLMAPLVPASARRDLKPPAFLHLDPAERFPRVTTRGEEASGAHLFGPFPDRRAAERARDVVQRLFSLRPCDFEFNPDPAWAVGQACLYAQVRSCAAPCLARTGEADYRVLAARAASWLADPGARPDAPPAVPTAVAAADGCAFVVDAGRREGGLYPVRDGRVLEDAAIVTAPAELKAAVARLSWPEARGGTDWSWLAGWLRSPKGRRSYVPVCGQDEAALARAVSAVLPARFGGNLGAAREEG
jgi:hypothetical protein